MNTKGSVIIYGMMLGVLIIFLGLALGPSLQKITDDTMNATSGDTLGLDCTNTSISTFDKLTCNAVDITLPYFIGTVILIGGLIVTAKIIFA